mmetsp:Transcript_17248/g.38022  ORF Transcript_17248/g.38022 Transcript_17248/m.38022 type:complete len:124 (+) Transcript_17248:397-768(+)
MLLPVASERPPRVTSSLQLGDLRALFAAVQKSDSVAGQRRRLAEPSSYQRWKAGQAKNPGSKRLSAHMMSDVLPDPHAGLGTEKSAPPSRASSALSTLETDPDRHASGAAFPHRQVCGPDAAR